MGPGQVSAYEGLRSRDMDEVSEANGAGVS